MTEETFRMLADLTAAITIAAALFALGAWKADRDLKRQRRACPPPEFVDAGHRANHDALVDKRMKARIWMRCRHVDVRARAPKVPVLLEREAA